MTSDAEASDDADKNKNVKEIESTDQQKSGKVKQTVPSQKIEFLPSVSSNRYLKDTTTTGIKFKNSFVKFKNYFLIDYNLISI